MSSDETLPSPPSKPPVKSSLNQVTDGVVDLLDSASKALKTALSFKAGQPNGLPEAENAHRMAIEAAQSQAQVQYELSVSERIRTAVEVEIEETYSSDNDLAVDGKAKGLGSLPEKEVKAGMSFGLTKSSGKVVKRTLRMKGFRDESVPLLLGWGRRRS